MKTINIKFIILAVLLITAGACDSYLDLSPKQEVPTDKAISDGDGIKNLLMGAYSGIQGTVGTNEGGELYGGHFNFFSELLGDDGDLDFVGTFQQMKDLYAKSLTSLDEFVRDSWIRGYDVINMVNIIEDRIDLVSESERDRILGEALGIRGTLYFEFARFWGKPYEPGQNNTQPGVPLKLTPVYTQSDIVPVPRSSVEDIYNQAISDLTQAKQLLEEWGNNPKRFSTYTASAMLSRLYLQQGEYQLAAEEASRVIESGYYSLALTPLGAFNKSSDIPEYVFAIQQNANSNAGESNDGLATFYASLNGTGRGDIRIEDQHLERYEPGDLREGVDSNLIETSVYSDVKKMFYIGIGSNAGNVMTSKYGDGKLNIPIVRLAEMYLTRAEGNFESGTQAGPNTPLDDINIIRERAGLDPLGAVDQGIIRNERRLELAFEGFKLHDTKRWKLDTGELPYDSPRLVLPIPQREIDVYPELTQNEGYLNQ